MAVNIEVDEPEIDIRVRTYDGYVEVTGISAPLSVGDAQVAKGDLVDAGPATSALMVGNAQTSKGDAVEGGGTSTAFVTGDGQTDKGSAVSAGGTSAQTVVGDAETDKGEATQAEGASAPLAVGDVEMEGPWAAPWRPEDRSLSSLDAAFTPYPSDPTFYLRFDEPHDVPKRIKDGWQRGTEATYWDGSQLQTAAPHEPRVQVDPVTGERYLLAEPQRSNSLPTPRSFDDFGKRGSVNILDKSSPAPDGTDTAERLEGDGSFGQHRLFWDPPISAGDIIVQSLWLKAVGSPGQAIRVMELTNFDGADPTLITKNFNTNLDIGTEWKRYYAVYEIVADGAHITDLIRDPGPKPKDGSYLEFLLWGGQFEVGRYPTSTIPDGGTRAPDDLSNLPFSMGSGAKSVYFRISQEANAYTPNEGGNITNAETNLTDSPGTAGGGLLRPSTGILGISASGWIDAVVNSTDEDLQGNSTSDVVDGLTIQPDKSPSTDGAIYRIHELVAWEEERSYGERRDLTSKRPQPWQELDPPSINTLTDLSPWDQYGIDEPPHFWLDVPQFGIPQVLHSVCNRSTEATYWGPNGELKTAGPYQLREQHDPTGGVVKGMLLEPGRTQQLAHPTDLTGASWTPTAVTTTGGVGTAKGQAYDALTEDGSTGIHELRAAKGLSDTEPGAMSAIVKANGRNWVGLISNQEDTTSISGYFDLANGVAGSVDHPDARLLDHSIKDLGNGWYRIRLAAKPDLSDDRLLDWRLRLANGDGSDSYAGDGSSGVYVLHAQWEASFHVTSPILQGGAARQADTFDYPFAYPEDVTSGVAYSAARFSNDESGAFIGLSENRLQPGPVMGTTDAYNKNHGAFGWAGAGFNSISNADGWYKVQRNTNEDMADGDPSESEVIDRLEMKPNGVSIVLRQLVVWPFPLDESQKDALANNYLTTP